jgi:hypothetical protein
MKKLLSGMAILGLMSSASALAAGSDELWEVTTKMEMPGMPFAMPAQTRNICMEKDHAKDPNYAVPKNRDQDCKMGDVKVSSNKSSWTMKCDGMNQMTGEGEMTRGDGTYSGKTIMHAKDGGEMKMVYEGKRVGTCQAKK